MKPKGSVTVIVLIVLLILIIAFSAWQFWQLKELEKVSSQQPDINLTEVTNQVNNSVSEKIPEKTTLKKIIDPGVTWLTEPIKLADQDLFTSEAKKFDGDQEILYYKTADLDTGGEIILAVYPEAGLVTYHQFFRFKKDSNNQFYFLPKVSYNLGSEKPILKENIRSDYDLSFRSITPPEFLDYRGETLTKVTQVNNLTDVLYSKDSALVSDQETAYGQIYFERRKYDPDPIYTSENLVLRLADSTLAHYLVKSDFVSDSKIPAITWNDGTKNKVAYNKNGVGAKCGPSSDYEAIIPAADVKPDRFEVAGVTSKNKKVYLPTSTADLLYKQAYESYTYGRDQGGEYAPTPESEYLTKKPIFIYKDNLDRYVWFVSQEYQPLAECGKPVIYLYPEKETKVSVSVGAEITKSVPFYQNQ